MEVLSKEETVASLPLQMALYFNLFFSPFWAVSHICTLSLKYFALDITYKVILVAAHFVSFIVEIVRLYLGFVGNLREKIPELSGFWITTLILQLPLLCFLLFYPGIRILPLERAVDMVLLAFLVFEIGSGFAAVRVVAKHQVTRFQHLVLDKKTT